MKTSRKIWIAVIAGLLAVVAVLAGVKAGQIGKMIQAGKSFTPPPETVTTAKVEAASWLPTRTAVGTLVAVRGVTLGAELPGTIREIHFDSGQSVRKGAVLVKLDTTTEEAQLQAALADAKLAEDNLARAVDLRKGEANTPADLDAARTRATQAQATVATLRTTIAKKTIQAPFDGRVAIRQVELGQVVSPGTPIASLQSVSPIYAEFWLPQQALADVKAGQKVRMTTDTFPGQAWEGTVSTVNTEVDVATRNVRLRATFPNPDGRLRPGMFANVEVLAGAARPVLVIPATAALFAPYGDSVFVLEEKPDAAGKPAATVTQRFVRLGERRGDLVAVESGLKEGDVVVSSGAFKLRSGAAVVVRNELAPPAEIAPRPADR
jgi:membrane fusion protein (multidrug efflux system)